MVVLLVALVALVAGAFAGFVIGQRMQTAAAVADAAATATSAIAQAAASANSAVAAAHATKDANGEMLHALATRGDDRAVIKEGLDKLNTRIAELEAERARSQGQLNAQVNAIRTSNEELRRETGALASALRRPQVRGQWGELHLRKVVESAGMSGHCDFSEQVHIAGPDGAARPDLVVNLAGGRQIVVDAKTPLDAFLDALDADESDRERHLERHAKNVRGHIETLSRKAYWNRLDDAVEMVVLFVPSDACLAAAMETDRGLLEYATERKVALVSPTSLIGMLRAIAHGWRAESIAEAAREIQQLGAELHNRLGTLGTHFDRLGKSLTGAVDSYNKTVASLETRVLVTARKFEDAGVTTATIAEAKPVEVAPRALTAVELLDEATPARPELSDEDFEGRRGATDTDFGRSSVGA